MRRRIAKSRDWASESAGSAHNLSHTVRMLQKGCIRGSAVLPRLLYPIAVHKRLEVFLNYTGQIGLNHRLHETQPGTEFRYEDDFDNTRSGTEQHAPQGES